MRTHALSDRAARDISAARNWYDQQEEELGNRFLDDVLQTIGIICERPKSFPLVARRTRATRCDRFPYRVYFRVEKKSVEVLAVYHTARNPKSWKDADRE